MAKAPNGIELSDRFIYAASRLMQAGATGAIAAGATYVANKAGVMPVEMGRAVVPSSIGASLAIGISKAKAVLNVQTFER